MFYSALITVCGAPLKPQIVKTSIVQIIDAIKRWVYERWPGKDISTQSQRIKKTSARDFAEFLDIDVADTSMFCGLSFYKCTLYTVVCNGHGVSEGCINGVNRPWEGIHSTLIIFYIKNSLTMIYYSYVRVYTVQCTCVYMCCLIHTTESILKAVVAIKIN